MIVPCDLTDRDSVRPAADLVLVEWGGVDVLVHNCRHLGPGLMDTFLDTPIEAYDRFVEAHGIAPLVLTRALLPGMLEPGGGTVITVTSLSAFTMPPAPPGKGGWGLAYAVGKGAGHQLVPSLHAQYKDQGIRAFNLEPGFVETERNVLLFRELGVETLGGAPPSALGAAAAWLATSPEADSQCGQTVEGQQLCRDHRLHLPW